MIVDTEDTIVAIASAAGGAMRGIVRISGPRCLELVGRVFESGETEASQVQNVRQASLIQGKIKLPALESFLPTMLYLWPNCRSYTRQPTAEFHTIGSPPLLEAVLAEVCRQGARLARPGEFTLRAFLAGRLDLTQAEAVLGVIDAGSEQELKVALSQLAGGIASPLFAVRGNLLDLLAHLEVGLDFVEEEIEFISRASLLAELLEASEQVERVARQLHSRGNASGVPRVVLCGLPNAGKSSLLNALAGEEVALVSSVAGTTRDFVSWRVCLEGVELELMDTAGLDASSENEIARQAQAAARTQSENCDLRLLCVEAAASTTREVPAADSRAAELHILTKCDLLDSTHPPAFLATSSRTGEGIVELRRRIAAALSSQPADSVASTAARCRESLALAAAALCRAIAAAEEAAGEEFVAAEIRAALDDLGQILGTIYTEDILDRIFSRFCIGK
jgi:tRNA modification GTPase